MKRDSWQEWGAIGWGYVIIRLQRMPLILSSLHQLKNLHPRHSWMFWIMEFFKKESLMKGSKTLLMQQLFCQEMWRPLHLRQDADITSQLESPFQKAWPCIWQSFPGCTASQTNVYKIGIAQSFLSLGDLHWVALEVAMSALIPSAAFDTVAWRQEGKAKTWLGGFDADKKRRWQRIHVSHYWELHWEFICWLLQQIWLRRETPTENFKLCSSFVNKWEK